MRMSDWSSDVCSSDLRAGGAVAVAEHEGGAAGAAVRPAVGRHRMAVDQDAVAEALLGLRHQAAQRLVVGPVVAADALQPFLQAQLAAVDAGAVGYHPGEGDEAGGDARGPGVGGGRPAGPSNRAGG